jgi:hypothetical protein
METDTGTQHHKSLCIVSLYTLPVTNVSPEGLSPRRGGRP